MNREPQRTSIWSISEGWQMLIEQGRAYERERIANGHTSDGDPPHSESGR